MRILLAFIGCLALSGCAGSPVADAIAGPEKLAAQDDAYCRSINAPPDSPRYTDCRLSLTQMREQRHLQAAANSDALLAAGATISAQPVYAPPVQPLPNILPQQTRCQTIGAQTNCTTY